MASSLGYKNVHANYTNNAKKRKKYIYIYANYNANYKIPFYEIQKLNVIERCSIKQ